MANSGENHFQHLSDNEKLCNEKSGEIVKQQQQEEEGFSYAMQLATLTVFSMALRAVTELGVFDVIKKEGAEAKLSAKEIAEKLCCKSPESATMLDRLLRLLASHSVVYCDSTVEDQWLYSLAPVAKYFAANDDHVSLGPLLLMAQDKVYLDAWSQLKDAVMEGDNLFKRVYGVQAFDYLGSDTRFNLVYSKAMVNVSTILITKILESYKGFEGINTLVDVGGGLGVTLSLITSKYPHIQGINFDLPYVIKHAPSYPGVQHVGGDMFESVPKGDAIFMKWVLSTWNDESCLKLLKNCYNAIAENGKLIIVEQILPSKPDTSTTVKSVFQIDVSLMTRYISCKERSEKEFLELATKAGFSGIRFACSACNYWVIEFFK